MIGCECAVCRSTDPRDTRLRPSLLVGAPGGALLVDTGPDMRTQLLRAGVSDVHSVLMTHTHADHLMGMDDIRQLNWLQGRSMPLHGTSESLEDIRRVFSYCFNETQTGGGKPQLELVEIAPYTSLSLAGLEIEVLTHWHGKMPVLSFIFGGRFAYVTDVSTIPWRTWKRLHGVETLVLGTVRPDPHPTHLGLFQAIAVAQQLEAQRTYFTHLSHHLGHAQTERLLPREIRLAYDGLRLTFS